MKSKNYDERQLLNRYRIGYQAMILMLFLVGINGMIKEFYYVWAPPLIEANVIIYIPATYFIIMGITKDAYLRKKDHPIFSIVSIGVFMVLCIYLILSSIRLETFSLIENGQLSHSIIPVILFLYSASIFIALLVRKLLDR